MKKDKPKLLIDWATHKAAKYACENWHYSKCIPKGKLSKFGVWEDGSFVGSVLFGVGANHNIHKPYKLKSTEVCELVRVALTKHRTEVSRIISICLKLLKKFYPGLKLVVSMADPERGHIGSVYQAGNWIFVGKSKPQPDVIVNGKVIHKRAASSRFGTIKGLKKTKPKSKLIYLMPLDDEIRQMIEPLRKPYPKRATSKDSVAIPDQGIEGGASPTVALHANEVSKV